LVASVPEVEQRRTRPSSRTDERFAMKHARSSRPRDIANDVLYAVGARRGQAGGRHRAPVPGDDWTPTSKLPDRQLAVSESRHRVA
jgi:hypothetical protein